MSNKVLKTYSVAFKRHVVSEYESGTSAYELKKRYSIGGNSTVENWVRQYGREGLRHKVMHIQHVDEQNRVKALEVRVNELESALAQVTLDRLMYQAMVDVAERDYGLDLKKKAEARSSNRPKR